MMEQRQAHHIIAGGQLNTAHAGGIAALKYAYVSYGETDTFAATCGEQHIVLIGANLHINDAIWRVNLHGNFAVAVDGHKVGELISAHIAGFCGEHDIEFSPL